MVNPAWDYPVVRKGGRHSRIWPPISLAIAASLLREDGYDVQILDANALRLGPKEVGEKARAFDRVFITSSPLDRWQCPNIDLEPFLQTLDWLEDPIVMGAHGTLLSEEILRLTKARIVIRGEPEFTVLDICKGKPLSMIEGITYVEDGRIYTTKDRSNPDLDKMPAPSYGSLPLDRYHYEMMGDHFMLFEASRGCPYRCTYCQKSMTPGYRKRSFQKVIAKVDDAVKKYGVRNAYFIDLEFTLNRDLVMKLCDHLIKEELPLRWCCQTRLDTIDKELLEEMKKAGCELIHYGVETGSERILKLIDKGISLETIRKGMKLTHDAGIKTACFFMFGFPGETMEDMDETLNFAKELNPTYASFHIWTPYPKTKLFNSYPVGSSELFPQAYSKDHKVSELEKRVHRAFMSYYLRPDYIAKRIRQSDLGSIIKQTRLFLGYLR